MLTQTRLKELLHYDPTTGVFTWRVTRGRTAKKGDIAGAAEKRYWAVSVEQRRYRAHRLAWFYVTGHWPEADVDHRNGDRRDNRLDNLRPTTRTVNMQNLRSAHADSCSGVLGASKSGAKWKAEISVAGKKRHLGVFDTPEQAGRVYLAAKRVLHEGNTL